MVDSQRLQQILKNLLANALKFTEHGKVSLHVRPGGSGRIRFEVCDTGIGIAREQLQVIFEAFRQADGSTRRRYGGTGLGLSISRDLAARMGGEIQVDSEPGRGSCFVLELPLQGAPCPRRSRARSPRAWPPRQRVRRLRRWRRLRLCPRPKAPHTFQMIVAGGSAWDA